MNPNESAHTEHWARWVAGKHPLAGPCPFSMADLGGAGKGALGSFRHEGRAASFVEKSPWLLTESSGQGLNFPPMHMGSPPFTHCHHLSRPGSAGSHWKKKHGAAPPRASLWQMCLESGSPGRHLPAPGPGDCCLLHPLTNRINYHHLPPHTSCPEDPEQNSLKSTGCRALMGAQGPVRNPLVGSRSPPLCPLCCLGGDDVAVSLSPFFSSCLRTSRTVNLEGRVRSLALLPASPGLGWAHSDQHAYSGWGCQWLRALQLEDSPDW